MMPIFPKETAEWEALQKGSYFLMKEAWLLDHARYDDWIEMLSPEIRYFAPVRTNANFGEDEGLADEARLAHFDETFDTLTLRVRRLQTGRAWSEEPVSRKRRFVSNVVLLEQQESLLTLGSNILIHREDAMQHLTHVSAYRQDRLKLSGDGGFCLLERQITLDHLAVPALTQII
jgi:3-phenylpropionate/cinnamic acid dioxygenase small subunit